VGAVIGDQRGGAGDVAPGFADGIDAAEHHVVDAPRVEAVAVLEGAEGRLGQAERRDLVQRPVRLAASAGGADVIVDVGLGHMRFLVSVPIRAVVPSRRGEGRTPRV
jgi:hypothetical protein